MTITLRAGGEQDMEWLMSQLRAFDKFAGYKRSLMEDEAHARLALKQLLDLHVVIIAEGVPNAMTPAGVETQRVGFIAGYLTPHPFNPNIRVLTESFWWVAPEHRAGRAGLMLLNEFDTYGRRYCDWVIFTLEHHSPVRDEALIKRGYAMKEKSFLLEV